MLNSSGLLLLFAALLELFFYQLRLVLLWTRLAVFQFMIDTPGLVWWIRAYDSILLMLIVVVFGIDVAALTLSVMHAPNAGISGCGR